MTISRSSTVEALSGAAAVIIVLCAWSGSVCGGTTSSMAVLRLTPSTSRVLIVCRPCPSSCTGRSPVRSLGGAFAHWAGLYITRVTAPRRTDSTANRSGSSSTRSSLRGHHAPSTYPVGGALGFNRSRGVFSGPAWRRPETALPSCVIRRSRLGRARPNHSKRCASALLGIRYVDGRRCRLSLGPLGCPLLLQRLTRLLAHRLPGRFISHH